MGVTARSLDFLLPVCRALLPGEERNKGDKNFNNILDESATLASRTLTAASRLSFLVFSAHHHSDISLVDYEYILNAAEDAMHNNLSFSAVKG